MITTLHFAKVLDLGKVDYPVGASLESIQIQLRFSHRNHVKIIKMY